MKKSLAHLPKHKQDELMLIKDTILKEFPNAQMIILFGSYARGNWVEETCKQGHIVYEYKSDYDILVITETKKEATSTEAAVKIEDCCKLMQYLEANVNEKLIFDHLLLNLAVSDTITL